MNIVTIYNDSCNALSSKAEEITVDANGLKEAKKIATSLIEVLKPLMPAAGLAAPQINIKKSVMIFTWDRTQENIQVAINPFYESIGDETVVGWEACFSTAPQEGPCRATLLPRYKRIKATFYDLEGNLKQLVMEGFAAKVFQHECDHLEGMVILRKQPVEVKEFTTHHDFLLFMKEVKQVDSVSYVSPVPITQLMGY